jgi:alpha-acetolactate decarboxylase
MQPATTRAMNPGVCLAPAARSFTLCVLAALLQVGCRAQGPQRSTELVRYGDMHETIAQRQDQGRVGLAEIVSRPHFYGVGAAAGLRGEVTIRNSVALVTGVSPDGRPEPVSPADAQATFLVGQSIGEWTRVALTEAVSSERFDAIIATAAATRGVDAAAPFMFVIDGEFTDVRLHVINGACPVHARMKNLTLDSSQRPFELEAKSLSGTLVGVYAADSVGKLTHPATSCHVHLIYEDRETGRRVTGHLERVGLAPGAVLKLPKPGVSGLAAAARFGTTSPQSVLALRSSAERPAFAP